MCTSRKKIPHSEMTKCKAKRTEVELPSMGIDRRMTVAVASSIYPVLVEAEGLTVYAVFQPLLFCLHYANLLVISNFPEELLTKRQKPLLVLRRGLRFGYLALMWVWTMMMSINIFWMAIAESSSTGLGPMNNQTANIIITFLEESPYSFIALRNAIVLTLFVWNSEDIWRALTLCEELRNKIIRDGGDPDIFRCLRRQPALFVITSVVVILLWEIYEWYVWFTTIGMYNEWFMDPFSFTLIHYQYAILWWIFVTIPFIFSQLAICVPTLFALVVTRYCRYLNTELIRLNQKVKGHHASELPVMKKLAMVQPRDSDAPARVSELRRMHYDISELVRQLDKTVRSMLLIQFVLDLFVLFGFLGLLLKSKDSRPPKPLLEWTFYIPTSLTWMFFLLYYNIPLIQMTSEGEKTHSLVHSLTFPWTSVHHERVADFAVFLDESRHTIIGFTGRKFFYINRAYLVTCAAAVASYFTVLAEILDRFYSNLDIRNELQQLQVMVQNTTLAYPQDEPHSRAGRPT